MATTINPLAGAENLPAIFTKQEAAEFLSCTVRYIERQIRAGRLRALKPTGKFVRIRRADLEKFLDSGATIGDGE